MRQKCLLFMKFVDLDNVAKYDVLTAGNSDWQLTSAVQHITHVTLPENKHARTQNIAQQGISITNAINLYSAWSTNMTTHYNVWWRDEIDKKIYVA